MPKLKIKDSELKALLAEVTSDLNKATDEEISKLSKADGDKEETPGEPPHDESAEASAPEAPPAEASAPAPEMSAPPAEASAPAPEASAPAADPAQEQAASPEALQAEYAKLDPEALKMHYLAAKSALFAVMGAGGPPPEASAPPAGPPAAPEASAPPMMGKTEVLPTGAKNGGEIKVAKSEESLNKAEKVELEALREQVKLQERLFELLNQPVRKAVTSVDYVAKSEGNETKQLSKSEIHSQLTALTADHKSGLSKSDRELITSYTLGTIAADKIEHLLKK